MTIRRWDPWSEMLTLREAMGRLLEDSYVRPAGGAVPATAEPLALDVFEDADTIEVTAALPGLRPEDVDITLQSDVLTIKGQRKSSAERKQGNYLVREQRSGSFFRSIQLPVQVDGDHVQANFEHGILRLTLPKAAVTKPRQIKIGTGSPTVDAQQLSGGQPAGASNSEPAAQKNGQTATAGSRG